MNIIQKTTSQFGLKYLPSFDDPELDYLDNFYKYNIYARSIDGGYLYGGPIDFTYDNYLFMNESISKISKPKTILEIGIQRLSADQVSQEYPCSTTQTILSCKDDSCIYIGVDIRDLHEYTDKQKNIFVYQQDSSDYEAVKKIVNQFTDEIDILVIDGNHSIYNTFQDFKNAELVKVGGCIILHDVNQHPGSRELYFAVDEEIFDKKRECLSDYGIASFIRIK